METKDVVPIEIQGDEVGCYLAYRGGHTVASFDSIEDARRFATSDDILAACRFANALLSQHAIFPDELSKARNALRTAIARATGEQS
jgi:hypothetical protein